MEQVLLRARPRPRVPETGERRFLDAWERLVDSWIEQVPPRADATEVAARRLQNWVYAREAFGGSPRLDERIADEVAWVRANLTRRATTARSSSTRC